MEPSDLSGIVVFDDIQAAIPRSRDFLERRLLRYAAELPQCKWVGHARAWPSAIIDALKTKIATEKKPWAV